MLNSIGFARTTLPTNISNDVAIIRENTVVLIAEDLTGMRNHAAGIIRKMFANRVDIIEAVNGEACVNLAIEHQPDLIILDVAMPVINGIRAAQKIWSSNPSAKILFWSQHHREIYIRDLARILPDDAIHGYILKTETDDKFEYAVNCILKHNNPYIDPVVRTIKSRLTRKDESLSDIEYETLVDISLGLTDKAIARRRHVSVRGVQNRVSILEAKLLKGQNVVARESSGLEVFNTRSRAILEAFKRGLIDYDILEEEDCELREWMASDLDD